MYFPNFQESLFSVPDVHCLENSFLMLFISVGKQRQFLLLHLDQNQGLLIGVVISFTFDVVIV